MATSVTSSGITFNDSTVQTTAASGGDWVLLDSLVKTSVPSTILNTPNASVGNYSILKYFFSMEGLGTSTTQNRYVHASIYGRNSSGAIDIFNDHFGSYMYTRNGTFGDGSISDSNGNGQIYVIAPIATSMWCDAQSAMGVEITIYLASTAFNETTRYPVTITTSYINTTNQATDYKASTFLVTPASTAGYYPGTVLVTNSGGSPYYMNGCTAQLYGLAK